jgi:hypothetical protein
MSAVASTEQLWPRHLITRDGCFGQLGVLHERALSLAGDCLYKKTGASDEKKRGSSTLKKCQNAEFSTHLCVLEPFWQECQPS